MMKAVLSSETLILTRATRLHAPEDGILHFCVYVSEVSSARKIVLKIILEFYQLSEHELLSENNQT
jgi:hypothetical protein